MPGIPEEEEELPEHMWGANSQSSGTQPAQGSASMGSNSLPAEGSESAMATVLHILASVLSRNNPYDNRGYRSQIRRNLKHKLKLAGMPIPDWLESTEDMPVKDFRDRCFKWAACLKAPGKAGRSIPEPPDRCVPGSRRRSKVPSRRGHANHVRAAGTAGALAHKAPSSRGCSGHPS